MKKVLTLLLILSIAYNSNATHVVGSDMFYRTTDTLGVYDVVFRIYRDCQGIQLCPNCPSSLSKNCKIDVKITNADSTTSAGTQYGISELRVLPNISGYDVVQLCKMAKSVCSNCGTRTPGSFVPGVEVYVFEGRVDLRSIPSGVCKVRVSYESCCRNAAITTLISPGSLSFYVDLIIDQCKAPFNNSPIFMNDPVILVCAGEDYIYNMGAFDPDNDSLSYNLGEVLVAANQSAAYLPPYTSQVPFPYLGVPGTSPPLVPPAGININQSNGNIQFRPMGNFISNLVVEVKQWRKISGVPTIIGTTRRDIQIYSQNCAINDAPQFRTYDSLGVPTLNQPEFFYNAFANQRFCMTISAYDGVNSWDTTDLSWPFGNFLASQGATMTPLYNPATRHINGPKLDSVLICFTPTLNLVRPEPYLFTVTASDRACPIPAKLTRGFSIKVNAPTGISETKLASFDFKIYPNPANKLLTLELDKRANSKSELKIYSVYGHEMNFKVSEHNKDLRIYQLDISMLDAGVYFISVEAEAGNVVKRFVKE